MAKKQVKKETFVINKSEVVEIKRELLKIIDEWDSYDTTRNKVGSLYEMAQRWNHKGEGPKMKQNNLAKTIRSLHLSNLRTPSDGLTKLIETYKKEFTDLGGKLEDLKIK